MSSQPKSYISPEQYLETERKAEFRSEYFQGEMFAMSGAQEPHVLAVSNLTVALGTALRDRCRVYPADMRVLVSASGLYTYPDLAVVCGKPAFADQAFDTLTNPVLLVEVLSPSTESYDRGKKFDHYRRIESLQQYVLVSTDRAHADTFTRAGELWTFAAADGLDAQLPLECVNCTVSLRDVYRNIEFPGAVLP